MLMLPGNTFEIGELQLKGISLQMLSQEPCNRRVMIWRRRWCTGP